jgi:hypothetical protein
MQVGGIDITDVIASRSGIAVYGYVGAGRSFVAGNEGHSDCAQTRAEGVVGEHDYAMVASTRQAGFPGCAPVADPRLVCAGRYHRPEGVLAAR